MSDSPHRLLLASAGTGKTYQLSGHFLRLLVDGVEPGRILATTFTRKAAGEILDRLFARLVDAAEDPARLRELAAQIERPALTPEDCRALLARLARRIDRFQVRTLDSFFVHLARLFALDLGLSAEWHIADEREDEELRHAAIARVLEGAPAAERLELLRALQQGAARRAVHEALLGHVSALRSEALQSAPDAWDALALPPGLAQDELAPALEGLAALEVPRTAKGTPHASWSKAKDSALAAAGAGDWEGFLELTLVQNALGEDPRFASQPIGAAACEVLRALARHAGAELLRSLARQNRAARELLARFEERYRELQREHGAFRFEDLAPLLLGVAGDERGLARNDADLWLRLDGRIDHLLLDEFQDTAPLQWRVLEPLAEEVLADGTGGRSLFCVGDVKQSIYGWRSAEPRLLAGLAARYPVLEPEELSLSWRSAQVVLDTVNRTFQGIEHSPAFAGKQEGQYRSAAARWMQGFVEHRAAKTLPGAACLREAPPHAEGESKEAPCLRLCVELVLALREEAPGATIGVLMRKNKNIPLLIDRLQRAGVRASGEGGNPLTDSEAVLCFLSLLHLADHPTDSAAAFHVATSPFGPHYALLPDAPPERAAELSRALRARLAREGYGGLATALLPLVEAEAARWSAWDKRRFERLIELGHAFDTRAGLRPIDFADHVRRERIDEPSASAVRVMTVHASKGLEFDAVVLPELDEQLARSQAAHLARRSDPYGPIDALTIKPKKAVCAADPFLSELSDEAQARELEESLSVLYVALTRAARRLDMIVQQREPEKRAASFAGLLSAALAGAEPVEEGVLWRHEASSEDWASGLLAPRPAAELARVQPIRLAPARSARPRRFCSPSAEEGGEAQPIAARAAELLRARPKGATRTGSLAHRWLEELEWIEDFDRGDEELLLLARRIEPDLARRKAALAEWRAALERPAVRAALSRAAHARPGLELEVRRERRFAVELADERGEPELWTGSIDRLVVARSAGAAVSAELFDFKTDRITEVELPARAAFYRPQLAAYRRAAARVLSLPESSIRARLLFLHPGLVTEALADPRA